MAIVFYYGSGSPFAWRVWLALEHKKLPYELRVMSFDKGDLKQLAFQALTPRGKVPLIQDGDYVLYESTAIMEYLQDAYPSSGASLFPADPKPRRSAFRRSGSMRRLVRSSPLGCGASRRFPISRRPFRRTGAHDTPRPPGALPDLEPPQWPADFCRLCSRYPALRKGVRKRASFD